MQALQQQTKNVPTPARIHATETGQGIGVPQSVSQMKKPSFMEGQDLRLQAAEALVFIRDMEQDLSADQLFYIDQVVDILNCLVDADHIDRAGVQEVIAWDF